MQKNETENRKERMGEDESGREKKSELNQKGSGKEYAMGGGKWKRGEESIGREGE